MASKSNPRVEVSGQKKAYSDFAEGLRPYLQIDLGKERRRSNCRTSNKPKICSMIELTLCACCNAIALRSLSCSIYGGLDFSFIEVFLYRADDDTVIQVNE